MDKVSIIIPSRNEKYLVKTVDDIHKNATGDYEVIVGLNGDTKHKIPNKYKGLRLIYIPQPLGLKPLLNHLANQATGKYLLKADAHTMWSKGFDEVLKQDMQDNWVVTPRFYVLDAKAWCIQDDRFYDYFYLSCPFIDPRGLRFKAGGHWMERTQERLTTHPHLDETPSMHGSGWFVNREYFLNNLSFPDIDPEGHAQEPIWLGLKNWLIGGKLMVNKKVWYAHLHQQGNKRGYKEDKKATEKTYNLTAEYWLRQPTFGKFVKKFYPMPTWNPNWQEELTKWRANDYQS